ncbi:cytochrome c-type biogenesis protein [Marinospirillum sp. MEB164]|uniref:Cytochrome c-type biogenesis protein n=1 Tax=Marinospirillum alkalitolerans TaxID=3123374 RepID=A0ABW8PU20_9GAMM
MAASNAVKHKLGRHFWSCWLLSLVLMGSGIQAQAAIELYDFSSEELRLRYQQVGGQLRCPMCENQAIIDSDSPSAFDMRQELYRLLEEGYTNQEIMEFMRARFGDFILYRPPVRSDTWLLWFLPPLLVLLGLLLIGFLVRQNQRAADQAEEAPLSHSERQLRLNRILELESSLSASQTTPQDPQSKESS